MLLQRWSYLQHLGANSADNLQENCKQISPDASRLGGAAPARQDPSHDWDHLAMPQSQRRRTSAAKRATKRRSVAGGCGSWSIPVEDGAYAGVAAWRSRSSWMRLLRELLESAAGVELCKGGRIKADTVMAVARVDAETADGTSGRGVTTSHKTVAKRLGMSDRHVGTARRIIEKLGLAVTIIRGRHLSPPRNAPQHAPHTAATRRPQPPSEPHHAARGRSGPHTRSWRL